MNKQVVLKTVLCVMAIYSVLLAGEQAMAADKVVVIPLGSAKHIKNVVTVSATGGDFTSPVAALASITTASAANPYLVLIGPGVYTLTSTLVMKPYVTIAGSGENATTLTGAISSGTAGPSAAIVSGANHAALRDLKVSNTGGGQYSLALANEYCSPVIENVTATASGGVNNDGVYNYASSPTMTNITASATGGTNNYGVYNNTNSSPVMTNIIATASGGTAHYGVYNYSASPTMINGTVTVTGGSFNYGVYNYNSSAEITGVSATASGGNSANYGMSNTYSSPVISHCTLNGTTKGLSVSQGTTRVMQSSILGGVEKSVGTLTCINSDNGVSAPLDQNCL